MQKLTCQILRKFMRNPRPDASLPREGWRVRKRTAPLARERRSLRSESHVFYRRLFRRIAPRAGQSAQDARILDRGGRSGPPQKTVPNCTVKHVIFATLDINSSIVLEIPAEKRQTAREDPQKGSGSHAIFDSSTQPPK